MNFTTWIAGPQMIGAISLIMGAILYRYPPKNMNNGYGYRMPSSLKNQQMWEEGNRYSAICMLKGGLVLVVAGLLITFILKEIAIAPKLRGGLTALFLIVSGPIIGLFIIVSTEKHLKIFDKEQK
ncbi:MAG: SdpI family protein [Mucilaginibacter sp.]|uniref:SdpI family protein n=1 Tax=Mucilaginibacter sp. TaxID=1882438 RepID=UPI0031AE19E2